MSVIELLDLAAVESGHWSEWAKRHSGFIEEALADARRAEEAAISLSRGLVGVHINREYMPPHHNHLHAIVVHIHQAWAHPMSEHEPKKFIMVARFMQTEVRPNYKKQLEYRTSELDTKKDTPHWLLTMVQKRLITSEWAEDMEARLKMIGITGGGVFESSGNTGGYGVRFGVSDRYGNAHGIPEDLLPWFLTEFLKKLRPIAEEMVLRQVFVPIHDRRPHP